MDQTQPRELHSRVTKSLVYNSFIPPNMHTIVQRQRNELAILHKRSEISSTEVIYQGNETSGCI